MDFPQQQKRKRKQSFCESAWDYPRDEDPLQESLSKPDKKQAMRNLANLQGETAGFS